ncbi:hypothetical protein EVAR_60433_1 [Eumeta japonica]|uniref:Uncharacterized protein n=1 Tax=Eumeta variegata TaxID=151549 RepID=A0A4C1ZK83_EUMVA|nr:hypothetical protein EVAR_60433_1 [Eumeta japonica]
MWFHHCDPVTKLQSMSWKKTINSNLQEILGESFCRKVHGLFFFWNSKVVFMIDYLNRGAIVTGSLNAEQIKKLRNEIQKDRRGKLVEIVLCHQDNALARWSAVIWPQFEMVASKYLSILHIHLTFTSSDFSLFYPRSKSICKDRD